MRNWTSGWKKLTRVWRADAARNVDEELRFHFERKVEEFVAAGAAVLDARARANAEFGDVATVRDSLRAINARVEKKKRRAEWWESVAQDLRYVLRSLRRSPAFTLTVVITLTLGLGANAALFSVLDKLYVQTPAGVRDAAHLMRVNRTMKGPDNYFTADRFALQEIAQLRRAVPTQLTMSGFESARVKLGRNADGADVGTTYVEGDYFGVAGVSPAVGRFFAPDEYRVEGVSMVAVISYRFWKQQFAGDAAIIGKTIDLGSHRHVIVGVAAEKFIGLDVDPSDIWVPLNTMGVLSGRDAAWYEHNESMSTQVVARVPSAKLAKAFDVRATATSGEFINGRTVAVDPRVRTFLAPIIQAKGAQFFGSALSVSTRLAGVTAAILMIACANVVNLLLARASSRQREVAVRLALGVSRRRLMTQLMMETGVLALISSLVALLVAYFGATTLRTLLFPTIHWDAQVVGVRLVVFTVALAMLSGTVAGIVPAIQASRPELLSGLKTSLRDGGQRSSGLRSGLLITQAALSIILLVGAGVFVQSLRGVKAIDIGYDADRLIFAQVSYDRDSGNHASDIQQRFDEAAERVRRLPGVQAVALSEGVPMAGFAIRRLTVPGRDSLPKAMRFRSIVSPEFFDAVGMRVLRGRKFTANDRAGSEMVMAVDENTARNLFGREDPLTKCVIVGKVDSPCRRIVAVVSPTHFNEVVEAPSMHYFLPAAQELEAAPAHVIVIRNGGPTSSVAVRAVFRELQTTFGDWSRPSVRTFNEILEPRVRSWRVGALLFSAAGLLALLVAAVGVYSSIAYSMSQRAHEMGVRVALGASVRNIATLVLRDGVRSVAIGVGVGIIASLLLVQFVSSLLYRVSPHDPFILLTAATTLLIVAVSACLIPALRASRVDPLTAMRAE